MAAPLATGKTNLQFKPVANASGISSDLETPGGSCVSSQSSNGDPSMEDSDCLSEDPFDKSSSHIASSNEDRPATTKLNCLQSNESFSETRSPSCQRFSFDGERVRPNEKEVPNDVTDGLSSHRERSSLDSETREMSESPTGKSSTASKGKIKRDS